jgi:hypothetical protein
MATKDNLPATPKSRDVLPAAYCKAGSLMARGLEAIKAQQAPTVPVDADPQAQIDAAVVAWRRHET